MYVCILYVCMYVCMYVCVYVCMNVGLCMYVKPVATGGARGAQPPWKYLSPPPIGCAVPFAVTIGIEVYPPLEFCQPPPLLTIPVLVG